MNFDQPPGYLPFGLTSLELSQAQFEFCEFARRRILGVGSDQYSDASHQKIETKEPADIIKDIREELADAVNYLAALDLHLERLGRTLKAQSK
jgi:hypothetical protein